LTNPIQTIQALTQSALGDINAAATLADLEKVRVAVLGRKGELAGISKTFGSMAPEDRAKAGQLLNEAKATLEKSFDDRKASLESSESDQRFKAEWFDLTVPPQGIARGHIHPVTQVQDEIEQLFISMGFRVLDGPEVETDYYNFDALNIPPEHPARDMQDTFWMTDGHLLRTHTSPVQVRALQKYGAPMRMIAPGRVFRNEEVDASHEHTFYQVEGMMVDRDVSVGNLLYFMQTLLSSIFGRKVTVRLRPGYFPFVEPGFELDIQCLICGGGGCAVCKQSGWVELLPCGLVHPNVIKNSGLDPHEWNGFAFGLGLTRLAMMRYAIDDIRLMQSGDLRFLNQF
jgi:phenylalanyl-tRNA synthetase alpha chain